MIRNRLLRWLCLGLLLGGVLLARNRSEVALAGMPYLDEDLHLNVELDLTNTSRYPIQAVRLYYREHSAATFEFAELDQMGLRYLASVDLSGYHGRMVEYFFDIEYIDGTRQAYPDDAPQMNLLNVMAGQPGFGDGDGDIVVITPEPGETIISDEFLLTVSFFRYSGQVDPERVRLFLDTWDVSRYVTVFNDFLTFSPKRVPPGSHKLRLELFDTSGRLLARREWSFLAHQRRGPTEVSREFNFNGSLFAETRKEGQENGRFQELYNRTGLNLSMESQRVAFGTRLFLSNREEATRQPINRYTGWGQVNLWNGRYLRLTGGDAYPRLNTFLLNNTFVRGFHGELFMKFLNFDYATGTTRRDIEGRVATVNNTPVDTAYGTYERKVSAMRLSFGAGEQFQLGFTGVKGSDQPNSIEFGRDGEESVGLGSDLLIALDKNRFQLRGSYNLSFYNPNILDGTDLPQDTLEALGVDIPDNAYDLAADWLTVNQYLIVLPGRAYEGQVRLNYFNNSFSAQYRYVQDEFQSLGQPFLQRDWKGITLTDNLRLFKNQVFLNLRYQQYENNLTDNKVATTNNRTFATTLSYFPMRNLPSLTVGFTNYTRSNTEDVDSAFVGTGIPGYFEEDNSTNTINFSTSYPFVVSTLKNRLTLNLLNYNRDDAIDGGFDNLSNTLSLNLQTRYAVPLKTSLEFTFQQTESTQEFNGDVQNGSELNLTSFGAGAEYRFSNLANQTDHLTFGINTRLGQFANTLTSSGAEMPTDYNRTFLGGRIVYDNTPLGRLTLMADWINYTGDREFEDYLLVARYDVTF